MIKKIKLKKNILIILLLMLIVVPTFISLAKYISKTYQYHQKKSESFFFTSNMLDKENGKIELFAQDGKTFSIYLYNYDYDRNNSVYISDSDIKYSISSTGLNTISLSSTSGTISSSSGTVKNHAKIDVTIPTSYTDNSEFTITASTTSPYKTSLSKTFVLHKERKGNSYIIEDTIGSNYATLTIKTLNVINKNQLTFDWTDNTSKGIDLDSTNKYLINSDYSVPSTIESKISTNTMAINAESQIKIIIFKQDKSEYFGTSVEQEIKNNKITIVKNN